MHDWLAGIFHTIWLAGWPRTPGSPEMADGMALDGGWPPPPAAAPDPELRTIVGDGYQAATAAVPGAGAPFFAVLGLVPGRFILKMGERTVRVLYCSTCPLRCTAATQMCHKIENEEYTICDSGRKSQYSCTK